MRDLDAIVAHVSPALSHYEEKRRALMKQRLAVAKQVGIASLGIFAAGFVVSLFVAHEALGMATLAVIAVFAAIQVYRLVIVPERAFRLEFESGVIGAIAKAMEPGITFHPDRGVSHDDFTKSRLYEKSPDRYRSEDGLHGTVGATAVHISEVHAEEERTRRDSKGRRQTYYETIFDGLFMVADFNKHFRGTTRVLPDTAERLLGGIGKALQDFRPFSSEDLVYLEDPEFEGEFVVYGSDQIESRYILTTSMLRRIVDLKRKWNSDVRLSFSDSRVYLAIGHRGDLLEPSLERAISKQTIGRIVGDLATCFDLVADLDLDTRIWSKE